MGTLASHREYLLDGRIVAVAADGTILHEVVFQASGESILSSLDASTVETRIIATHLDARPIFDRIAIAPDGKRWSELEPVKRSIGRAESETQTHFQSRMCPYCVRDLI